MLAILEKEDALAGCCRLLNEGGHWRVYQVPLQDDLVVAIKCVSLPTLDYLARKYYLESLGFIHHRNLVQLLAYVVRTDLHFFVYEFVPGGSLQDALNQMAAGKLTLSWPQRHRILCGVARGLAGLHDGSLGISVVLLNLKPANILLDEGYEAKIGAFSLASIMALEPTHSTSVAGTGGLIVPKYPQVGWYLKKSDVYSYGNVIAQLVTARSPTDQFVVENGGSIGQWLRKCLESRDGGMEAIDSALRGSGYEPEILQVIKVAVFCTNRDREQQPTSSEALQMLFQIRNPRNDDVPTAGRQD